MKHFVRPLSRLAPWPWRASLAAAALLLGLGAAALVGQNTPGAPLPPIVFVSRAHINTLNDYDVGPPVEVLGRELTVGGNLYLLRPNGEIVVLAGEHNGIFDVQRPSVSFDGTRVAFSGVRIRNGMWRIFEVRLDGTGLRQVTPEDRGVDIPDDPRNPRANASTFGRYGDFSPVYLPDGRIAFSSTRYPSVSGSCGQRGLTLYVINADGSNLRRIVSTRTGAINPSVMADGRILYAMWADNMNAPAYGTEGLQPLEGDRSWGSSFFEPWAVNPDGSGTGRVGFLAGFLTHGSGAGVHYREMPNGEIVYTRRATASFLGHPLVSSIAKFRPGDGAGNTIDGIGDPVNANAPHALTPEPLPDGRILFSYTPAARLWTEKQRTLGEFDYGLYVCDGDFKNLRLVWDNPGTEELDPVAVYPRKAQVVPDQIKSVAAARPDHPISGVAIFESRSIYADIDRRFTHVLSPLPGSVTAIDIYDDAQTFTTTADYPYIRKQMPRFYKSFPVNPDGSFRAEIPADRPVLYFLRGPSGVAARYPGSYQGEIRTPIFGHEQLRPGEVLQCTGCHRGHMIRPELSPTARVNIARLAIAAGSTTKDGSSYFNPARVLDGFIGQDNGRYQWIPAVTDIWPWVRLSWGHDITPREVVLYPRPGVTDPIGWFEIYLSNGRRVTAHSDPAKPEEPITVALPEPGPVKWIHFQMLSYSGGGHPGIAEIVVSGDPVRALGDVPPAPVPSATLTAGTLRLSWSRSPSPYVLGYKIFAGPSPNYLPIEWDVGNQTYYQPEYLTHNQKYYFQVRPYDAGQFGPPQTQELSGTATPPRVDRITPSSGQWWGGIEVTIDGADFLSGVTAKIGGSYLSNIKLVSPNRITATTPRISAGTYDVMVRNAGQMENTLFRAFKAE